MPFKAGSTILASASMSCSWGVAHLTKDCSDLGLELMKVKDAQTNNGGISVKSSTLGHITKKPGARLLTASLAGRNPRDQWPPFDIR